MEDEQIVQLLFERKEEAIEQLDIQYGRRLLALSIGILHNAEDARECLNETWWKTWNAIPPEKPDHLFAYLAQICRNQSLNCLARGQAIKRRAEIVELTDEMQTCIPNPVQMQNMESKELREKLNAFLEMLPRESRLLFLRRYWYSESVSSIAKRYGLKENAVSVRLHRIRVKLKKYLEQEEQL